jgi:hypothetical protein
MSSSPKQRTKIGDFLLRRLKEAGVRHLFGVPGDYNLELLQQLQDAGALQWIGTCSELNASYAAVATARASRQFSAADAGQICSAACATRNVSASACSRLVRLKKAFRPTAAIEVRMMPSPKIGFS